MMQAFHDPLVSLHEITLSLLAEDSSEKLLDTLLSQAIEYTSADSGTIALLNEDRKYLDIKSFHGLSQDIQEKVKLKLGEGVTGRCILTGKVRNVGDTSQDPYYIEIRPDIRSELAIPLKVGPKCFGVLSVDSSKLHAFDVQHEEYLEMLASYAAQVFTNQQALSTLKHRTHIQNVLLQLGTFLGKYEKTEELFADMVKLLEKQLGLDRAAIFLYDDVSHELYIVAGSNFTDEEKKLGRYRPDEGITGKVFSSGNSIAIDDISKDKNFLNKTKRDLDKNATISFFASPILLNEEVRGVFIMELPYTSRSHFEDYTFLVQLLSTLIAQAIQIEKLIEQRSSQIRDENIALKRQLRQKYSYNNIIGKSPGMRDLFEKMQMAADSASSVLLIGESGTGKELIATALHQNSSRRDENLVKINCAAIPDDLLESELFGSVKGAYTGANEDRKGKFLAAHRGTLFLDEIGEMNSHLQSKLLRVLQEKEFSPLGSNKVYKVDVRIVAATNANLEKLVEEHKFREDLYYRLNVVRLDIPPLRERSEDLPLLVQHLIAKIAKANNKKVKGLSQDGYAALEKHDFPGNVRELENILERAIVLTSKSELTSQDLQINYKTGSRPISEPQPAESLTAAEQQKESTEILKPFDLKNWVKEAVETATDGEYRNHVVGQVEKELIRQVLQKNLFNKTKTAKLLGINRLTLDRKINDYDLLSEMTS